MSTFEILTFLAFEIRYPGDFPINLHISGWNNQNEADPVSSCTLICTLILSNLNMLVLNYVINKLRNNYIYIPRINIGSFFITFFTVVTVCCFWFFGFILAFVANHVIPSLISDNPQNLPNDDASSCLLLKML